MSGLSDMSANVNIDPTSTHGDIGSEVTVDCAGIDMLIARARCCRDWPVLAWTRMGRCGYCGEVPVVIGPW